MPIHVALPNTRQVKLQQKQQQGDAAPLRIELAAMLDKERIYLVAKGVINLTY